MHGIFHGPLAAFKACNCSVLDAGICDNVDLREALFMEDEPSVLAAADTKPGQQQSLLFCATESQSECQMMIGGLKRETRWIQHQSYECMYANYLIFAQKSPDDQPASYRTFCRCVSRQLKTTWSKIIRIRKVSQHSRQAITSALRSLQWRLHLCRVELSCCLKVHRMLDVHSAGPASIDGLRKSSTFQSTRDSYQRGDGSQKDLPTPEHFV